MNTAAKPYRTNIKDVPYVGGLKKEDGGIDMQLQFLTGSEFPGSFRLRSSRKRGSWR